MHRLGRFEGELHEKGFQKIAGVDEAGCGPLAGPVVAAAVIFTCNDVPSEIDDSKKLPAIERERIYDILVQDASVLKGVGICDEQTIDRINIRQAAFAAMRDALVRLSCRPDYVLVDGFSIPDLKIRQRAIPKGDGLSFSIAAASILAKVTRDRIMDHYDELYPGYGFKRHKGYATQHHFDALKQLGPCPIHRMSFEPLQQLRLFAR